MLGTPPEERTQGTHLRNAKQISIIKCVFNTEISIRNPYYLLVFRSIIFLVFLIALRSERRFSVLRLCNSQMFMKKTRKMIVLKTNKYTDF